MMPIANVKEIALIKRYIRIYRTEEIIYEPDMSSSTYLENTEKIHVLGEDPQYDIHPIRAIKDSYVYCTQCKQKIDKIFDETLMGSVVFHIRTVHQTELPAMAKRI